MSSYCYSPVPEGSIRLLRLKPCQDEYAPIQCQLFEYPLVELNKGTHMYEALSYVWGSPENSQSISTDGGILPVAANLHATLSRLRDHALDRVIWVDAICINQDDKEERNRQVQSMAEIYAKARCVVVWLRETKGNSYRVHRETITDSDRALEEIHIAADGQAPISPSSEKNHQVLSRMLQQSCFRRIWGLQEVAAARHVMIVCQSTEIDGFAFYLGLKALGLSFEDLDTQSRISSVAYLIEQAIFQPKRQISRLKRFSLDIRPLGELIDMYHNREASDRRDKVYALLGMSSDNHIPDVLLPDYTVFWKDLFHRLVMFLIGEEAFVQTWHEKETALIQNKGCGLGEISSVEGVSAGNGQQNVEIVLRNAFAHSTEKTAWNSFRCTLQDSAKLIRRGDIICRLHGASNPTIIRPCEDYYAVIAITINLAGTGRADIDWKGLLRSITAFPRDVLLVWDWETSWGPTEDHKDLEHLINLEKYEEADTQNWCPGRSVLQDTNLWLKDFAQMHKSVGVRAAIQSLAGIYIYDYVPLEDIRLRVNQRFSDAEERFSQLLQDPATATDERQADELITIAVILSMQDIVLTERRREKPLAPRWLQGFRHGEQFLQSTDHGSRFWKTTNVQSSSLRTSQSIIVGRAVILAQFMSSLPSPNKFDAQKEVARFGWLLYGTEKDMFQIHGGCGFSKKLLHVLSQVTYCASRLLQEAESLIVPMTAGFLYKELLEMRQWSTGSNSWDAVKSGPPVMDWVRSQPDDHQIDSNSDMTDVTAEAWRFAAILYLQCRVFRLPRNHHEVMFILDDLARCIEIMPTSGTQFTAQAPLFPVFLLGVLATVPRHKMASSNWFDEVLQTPVRSSVPPLHAALVRICSWIDTEIPLSTTPMFEMPEHIHLREPWWEKLVGHVQQKEKEVLCVT